jgi:hypothetical protein
MTVGVSLFFPEELVFPEEAGQVSVRYGSETGFSGTSTQSFFQGNPFENDSQVGEQREAFDRFGSVLAAGDFNADQLDDLAIGVPNEDVGGEFDAGLVHILYGSQIGLARFSDILTQAVSGVSGTPEPGDRFGAALAVGNLNGAVIRTRGGGVGSMNDLVVGAPGEAIGSDMVAGAVHVFFGSLAGITTSESQFWSQDEIGSFSSEPADQFGKAIAVADFDGDGKEDLAIGVPGEDMGGKTDVGVVHILYGTPSGPTLSRRQNWNQDTSGMIGGGAGNSDFFGSTLSAWNFGKSGHADLAVAAPGRDYFPAPFAHPELSRFQVGMVSVIYGSSSRLTVTGNQQWHQDSPGILDSNEDDDQFGKALY